MKKWIALLLALVLALSLVACSAEKDNADNTENDQVDTEQNGDADTGDTDTDDTADDTTDGDTVQGGEETTDNTDDTTTDDIADGNGTDADDTQNAGTTDGDTTTDEGSTDDTTTDTGDAGTSDSTSMSLEDILTKITDGVELPETMVMPIEDAETFNWMTFGTYVDGAQALAADAWNGSIPHSLVLVQVPDGASAADLAAEMDANKDPRKWICVEAEKAVVTYHGNTILLIMSSEAAVDAIVANFDALLG